MAKIRLKNAYLKYHLNLPGVNQLHVLTIDKELYIIAFLILILILIFAGIYLSFFHNRREAPADSWQHFAYHFIKSA